MGKHSKKDEKSYRGIVEDIAVATTSGLLVKLIEMLIDWLIKK